MKRFGGAVGAALASIGFMCVSGCTSARDSLGSSADQCFSVLPIAAAAVEHRGRFAGVVFVSASTVDGKHQSKFKSELVARAGHPLTEVCLVAYEGSFTLDEVQKPLGAAPSEGSGRFAIVVVEPKGDFLLATFVTKEEPVRFKHDLARFT